MQILKSTLMAAASVVIIAGILLPAYYLREQSFTPVEVTTYDLEAGTAYLSDERAEFTGACMTIVRHFQRDRAERFCTCVADLAEDHTSRYERLFIIAGFEITGQQAQNLVWNLSKSDRSMAEIRLTQRRADGLSSRIRSHCARKVPS